jgi:CRISPR-associated protein Csb2
MGFALVPPHGSDLLEDPTFLRALRAISVAEGDRPRRLEIKSPTGTPPDRAFSTELSPTFTPSSRSLQPARYLGPAETFATVTPIVLDRHLKKKGGDRDREVIEQLSRACERLGLPEPSHVQVGKHSALEGAVSARPSRSAPAWTRWRLPASLATRPLTHATVRFDAPVSGPVLLGAGRYFGMGLCIPLDGGRR